MRLFFLSTDQLVFTSSTGGLLRFLSVPAASWPGVPTGTHLDCVE